MHVSFSVFLSSSTVSPYANAWRRKCAANKEIGLFQVSRCVKQQWFRRKRNFALSIDVWFLWGFLISFSASQTMKMHFLTNDLLLTPLIFFVIELTQEIWWTVLWFRRHKGLWQYTWKYLDAIGINKRQTQTVNWGEQLKKLSWKNNESDYLWKC